MEKHDLSFEKRFLDLLGYEYVVDTPNRWIILDDNKKEVGYIEAKENNGDNSHNKIGNYIYHTVIDSDTIYYDHVTDDNFLYHFTIKNLGYSYFRFDDNFWWGFPVLSIRGIDDNNNIEVIKYSSGIGMEYSYHVNGYIVRESIFFENKKTDDKDYQYSVHYYQEDKSYSDSVGFSISAGKSKYSDQISSLKTIFPKKPKFNKEQDIVVGKGKIKLFMQTIKRVFNNDSKKKTWFPMFESYPTKAQTIEEFAVEHGRGLELFQQTHRLINEILPLKKDILYEIFKDKINECGLNILFDENEKQKIK